MPSRCKQRARPRLMPARSYRSWELLGGPRRPYYALKFRASSRPRCPTSALTLRAWCQYLLVNVTLLYRVVSFLRITRTALTSHATFRSHHLDYASRPRPRRTHRCTSALRLTWRRKSRPEKWMVRARASPKKDKAKVPGQAGK